MTTTYSEAVSVDWLEGDTWNVNDATYVAVEVKRRGTIDAVEQLCRYLEYLRVDPYLKGGVRGVLVAQQFAPQARMLAMSRGIRTVVVDYDELRGMKPDDLTLF